MNYWVQGWINGWTTEYKDINKWMSTRMNKWMYPWIGFNDPPSLPIILPNLTTPILYYPSLLYGK